MAAGLVSWRLARYKYRCYVLLYSNLHLHEGIFRCHLYICIWQPPADYILNLIFGILTTKSTFRSQFKSILKVPTNLHLDNCEGILEIDLYICTWLLPGSSFSGLQEVRYHFWYENWNPGPYKTTFRHTWRHIRDWPLYLYLASLQYQTPGGQILFLI